MCGLYVKKYPNTFCPINFKTVEHILDFVFKDWCVLKNNFTEKTKKDKLILGADWFLGVVI